MMILIENRPFILQFEVIALAELNRWAPGALYDLSVCSNVTLPSAGPGQPTCGDLGE